jgi:hypothetical protein
MAGVFVVVVGALLLAQTNQTTGSASLPSATPASVALAPIPTPTSTPAQLAEDAVATYYSLLDKKQFADAWNLLTPHGRSVIAPNGQSAWQQGYANTQSLTVTPHATSSNPNSATVHVDIRFVDVGKSPGTCSGTWSLVNGSSGWKLNDAAITC